MVEDFADHPISLTEVKSDKTSDASDWTPRDVLIATLREIDSGKVDVQALVLSYKVAAPDMPGGSSLRWRASTANKLESLGLAAFAQISLHVDDR